MLTFLFCLLLVLYLVWRMVESTMTWYDTYEGTLAVRLCIASIYLLILVGVSSELLIWGSHGL